MFEVLEHSADVGFRARATSLAELFENAGAALAALAMETGGIQARESYPLTAEGDSNDSLLVNWLSEILYCIDGRTLALRDFKVAELDGQRVRGQATGEHRDPARHPARLVVKGITYHQLKVEQVPGGWVCEVFVDV
jgi:SHS2 domain-containing protein